MEDVGRAPAELTSAPTLEPTTIPTLDGWIEGLMSCKQLPEIDVQRLCEKVGNCFPVPAQCRGRYGELLSRRGREGSRAPYHKESRLTCLSLL